MKKWFLGVGLWFLGVGLWMLTFAALRLITGVRFSFLQVLLIAVVLPLWRSGNDAIERRYPARRNPS